MRWLTPPSPLTWVPSWAMRLITFHSISFSSALLFASLCVSSATIEYFLHFEIPSFRFLAFLEKSPITLLSIHSSFQLNSYGAWLEWDQIGGKLHPTEREKAGESRHVNTFGMTWVMEMWLDQNGTTTTTTYMPRDRQNTPRTQRPPSPNASSLIQMSIPRGKHINFKDIPKHYSISLALRNSLQVILNHFDSNLFKENQLWIQSPQ